MQQKQFTPVLGALKSRIPEGERELGVVGVMATSTNSVVFTDIINELEVVKIRSKPNSPSN